jgi:hypothetical protein
VAAAGFEPYLILILAFVQLINKAATIIIRRFIEAHFLGLFLLTL